MDNFTSEETERIIARASRFKNKDGVSRMELLRIADQMGIDPQSVQKAINEERIEFDRTKKLEEKRRAYLKGFYWHLAAYSIVNGFLLFVDLVTGPPLWVYWPMLGWGIGLAFHALPIVFKKLEDFQEDEDQ